jgi:hypothetical protein
MGLLYTPYNRRGNGTRRQLIEKSTGTPMKASYRPTACVIAARSEEVSFRRVLT